MLDAFSWWRHQTETFPRYWPFARSPVNSPQRGQWRGALMFSLICVWINDWVNNREAGNLRRCRAHYDVIVMHTLFGWRIVWIPVSGINMFLIIYSECFAAGFPRALENVMLLTSTKRNDTIIMLSLWNTVFYVVQIMVVVVECWKSADG